MPGQRGIIVRHGKQAVLWRVGGCPASRQENRGRWGSLSVGTLRTWTKLSGD